VRGRWVIFCRVIDNLGDAGVCWRLACQLTEQFKLAVDLVIDQPHVLARFGRRATTTAATAAPLRTISWLEADDLPLGDTTIAAFACRLPANYQQRLAARQAKSAHRRDWFNLEYLSAQKWVEQIHLLASTHADGSVETFFMPGFTEKTGGLIREQTITPKSTRDAIRRAWGIDQQFAVSLFCYPTAPVSFLLEMLSAAGAKLNSEVVLLVNEDLAIQLNIKNSLISAQPRFAQDSSPVVRVFPFQSQSAYDDLLLACDLNFVRGEDSWVRAIWAGQPFIWQAYEQDSATVQQKVRAFADQLPPLPHAPQLKHLLAQWNSFEPLDKTVWQTALAAPAWRQWQECSAQYCDRLSLTPDLASQLVAASTTI
jgi:uncharacterized repeat protein (TIGR03837 family)